MLLRDVLKEYKFDCKARKLSVKTIDGYVRMNGYLFDYLEKVYGICEVEQVRAGHIKHFLLLKEEMGAKPQYINDLLKVFKCYFKYCVDEEYIQTAPTAKVHNVKQPKVLIRTFNETEIRKMMNYCNGRDFVSMRNKALLAILFDTGMRLNEIVTMKREQIFDEYILVHGKGNKERLVPVSPFLSKVLIRYVINAKIMNEVYDIQESQNKIREYYIEKNDLAVKSPSNPYVYTEDINELVQEVEDAYSEYEKYSAMLYNCVEMWKMLDNGGSYAGDKLIVPTNDQLENKEEEKEKLEKQINEYIEIITELRKRYNDFRQVNHMTVDGLM